jgi:Leucine-rich repeat (LRR) protein
MSEIAGVHLNLWKMQLDQVPDSLWKETEAETLVLAENGLTEVSGQIGQLKKLRMLDLGHNRLSKVPDEVGDLDGLSDFFYLHDNLLTSLPLSFGRLKKLRYLNISQNRLARAPGSGLLTRRAYRASRNRQSLEGNSGFDCAIV